MKDRLMKVIPLKAQFSQLRDRPYVQKLVDSIEPQASYYGTKKFGNGSFAERFGYF